MKKSTKDKIKALGLDPKDFTTDGRDTLEGRTVLADPKLFGKDKDRCLFKATGGFGCSPTARGSAVFVERVSDGQAGRIERHEVIAIKREKPDLSSDGPYATAEDEQGAKERGVTVRQVRAERAADDLPQPEEECPNCKNGTIGLEGGRLACRGECGHDFGVAKP